MAEVAHPAGVGHWHASNQGWGAWEVGRWRVFTATRPGEVAGLPTEWRNLFLGNGTVPGKYGFLAPRVSGRRGYIGEPFGARA